MGKGARAGHSMGAPQRGRRTERHLMRSIGARSARLLVAVAVESRHVRRIETGGHIGAVAGSWRPLVETVVDIGEIEAVVANKFGCRKQCLLGVAFDQGRDGARHRRQNPSFDHLELRGDMVVDDNPEARPSCFELGSPIPPSRRTSGPMKTWVVAPPSTCISLKVLPLAPTSIKVGANRPGILAEAISTSVKSCLALG